MDALKRAAAARALESVRDGMVLGLGTGSTIRFFLDLLGERVRAGNLSAVVGVPTSRRTAEIARGHAIRVSRLRAQPRLDLTVDGADEVDPHGNLIKGLGGALLREKIVAQASDRFIVIVDESKVVERLGTRSPLPVEVTRFGSSRHQAFVEAFGAEVALRRTADGSRYVTSNGNYILDARFPEGIDDPAALDGALRARAGIVENGLFLGMTTRALIAAPGGVRSIEPGGTRRQLA
ncbi:MAG: ribose-5-phosphate isomerase RpiA [Gammaproteobacteria bacterium]|nr:ribose-5-phosphate isomerase RpiA [Gammaproteobacteria bacterium]MYF60839.1 ribose-5-phosphate isomerase RpiA [Gammaproteobacteria bacterium]